MEEEGIDRKPFDNRKFILPNSRFLGPPPWSFSPHQVAQKAARPMRRENTPEDSTPKPPLKIHRGFVHRFKVWGNCPDISISC